MTGFTLKALLAAACLLAIPLQAHAFTTGSGIAKSETRTPGKFTKIETSGAITVEVTAGQSATILLVSGDDNLLPLLQTTVAGDVLKIRMDESNTRKVPLVVKIAMPKLTAIDASGASRISVTGLNGERFALDGSGGTKAVLGGKIDKFAVDLSGAGRVDAFALEAKTATISISGAGHVDINASEKLDLKVSGAGKVIYMGRPAITKSISGAAKVQARG